MKKLNFSLVVLLIILCAALFLACNPSSEDEEGYLFKITYDSSVCTVSDNNYYTDGKIPYGASVHASIGDVMHGYFFAGWYEGDKLLSKNQTYSFDMPDHALTIDCRVLAVYQAPLLEIGKESPEISVTSNSAYFSWFRFVLQEEALISLKFNRSSSTSYSEFLADVFEPDNLNSPIQTLRYGSVPLSAGTYCIKLYSQKPSSGTAYGTGTVKIDKTPISGALTLNEAKNIVSDGKTLWYKLSLTEQTAVNLHASDGITAYLYSLINTDTGPAFSDIKAQKDANVYGSYGCVLDKGSYYISVSLASGESGTLTAENGVIGLNALSSGNAQGTVWHKLTLTEETAVALNSDDASRIYAADDLDTELMTFHNKMGSKLPAGVYYVKHRKTASASLKVFNFDALTKTELILGGDIETVITDKDGAYSFFTLGEETEISIVFKSQAAVWNAYLYSLGADDSYSTIASSFSEISSTGYINRLCPVGSYYIYIRSETVAEATVNVEYGKVLPFDMTVRTNSSGIQWFKVIVKESTGVIANRSVSFFDSNLTTQLFTMGEGEARIFAPGNYYARIPQSSYTTSYDYQLTAVFTESAIKTLAEREESENLSVGTYGKWYKFILDAETAVRLDVSQKSGTLKASLYASGDLKTARITEGSAQVLSAGIYYVKLYSAVTAASGTVTVSENGLSLGDETGDITLKQLGMWYKLVLTEQTAVNLTLTENSSYLYAYIYAKGNLTTVLLTVRASDGYAGKVLSAGTYYIRLDAGTHAVTTSLEVKEGVITENEICEAAFTGTAGLWYKLVVDEGDKYDFTLSETSGSFRAAVYASALLTGAGILSLSGNAASYIHLNEGTYFVRLYAGAQISASGTFKAETTTLNAVLNETTDTITVDTKGVWFRLEITEQTAVNVRPAAPVTNLFVALYSPDNLNSPVAESSYYSFRGSVVNYGTYYIRLFAYQGTLEGAFTAFEEILEADSVADNSASNYAWYKFILTEEAAVYLDSSAPLLYSASNLSNALISGGVNGEKILQAGIYFIRGGNFTLKVRTNLTKDRAATLPLGAASGQHVENAWYTFTLSEETATQLTVYGSLSKATLSNDTGTLLTENRSRILPAGTYYVNFYPTSQTGAKASGYIKVSAYSMALNASANFNSASANLYLSGIYNKLEVTEDSAVKLIINQTSGDTLRATIYSSEDLTTPLCSKNESCVLTSGTYYVSVYSTVSDITTGLVLIKTYTLSLETASENESVSSGGTWYKLILPQETSVQLNVSSMSGILKASIFTVNGNSKTEHCSEGGGCLLAAGVYFVRLYSGGSSSQGTVLVTGRANTNYENASAYSVGTASASVAVDGSQNLAWYKFTLTSPAAINLSVTSLSGDLYAAIYSASDVTSPLAALNSSARNGVRLASSTYYVKLYAYGQSMTTGFFKAEQGILNLDIETVSETIEANIWYSLNLTKDMAVTLLLSSVSGSLEADIWDGLTNPSISEFNDYDTRVLTAGTYFIRLYTNGGAAEGTLLAVGHTNVTKETSAELALNEAALAVTTGSVGADAWYTFTLDRTTALNIFTDMTEGSLEGFVYGDQDGAPILPFNGFTNCLLPAGTYFISVSTAGGVASGTLTVAQNKLILNADAKSATARDNSPVWYEISISTDIFARMIISETIYNLRAYLFAYDDLDTELIVADNAQDCFLTSDLYFIRLETTDAEADGTLALIQYFTVTFKSYDGASTLRTETVLWGKNATPPAPPNRGADYTFSGWSASYIDVRSNLTIYAQYDYTPLYTVVFEDWNGTVLSTQAVRHGYMASAPTPPGRTGYIFTGYSGGDYTAVTRNMTLVAQYAQIRYYYGTIYDAVRLEIVYGAYYTSPQTPSNIIVRDVAGNVLGTLKFSQWLKVSEYEYRAQYTY